uniref:Uncharacterized protein n=1 Tax=Anguilla anguilla TaxID=7936 RepID=A0A0E9VKT6_ANGAN
MFPRQQKTNQIHSTPSNTENKNYNTYCTCRRRNPVLILTVRAGEEIPC